MTKVSQIDPRDGEAFDAWFSVLHASDQERWPQRPGWQREERLAMALDRVGPEDHRCLVAQCDEGEVIGIAALELYRFENRHVARVDIRVRPDCRRMGIGSAIEHAAEEMARAEGRRELGGMDEVPSDGKATGTAPGASSAFARSHGFAAAQQLVRRDLPLPPDAGRMEALQRQADAALSGYTLSTFWGGWAEDDLEDRCELGRRMSTDIPLGEQSLDEEVWDPARVRQLEANLAAQNRAMVITAARHDASGRIVAFTEVAVPRGAPESVWQHDTLVMREHRGHRLGLAVKLANTTALVEAYPQARTVSSWNAAENEHMIAINDAMGYDVVARSTYWLKSL
jgi:GNAT superfamily N-acetyltransferase